MNILNSIILPSKNEINLYKISGEHTGKTVLIVGVFHGEEPQGFLSINNYFKNFNEISKNNIFIIPCLNPDGMAKNRRKNSNGVDLNRNFPTKNWELKEADSEYFGGKTAGSEAETMFLINIIEKYKPDLILTLHSPYAIVNYDGPAQNEAEIISKLTNYPVQKDIGYPTPGSFGNYCGVERNNPTITLEYSDTEALNTILFQNLKTIHSL